MPEMNRFAHGRGIELTVIETMPVGEIEEDRTDDLKGEARMASLCVRIT